ncbi:hypothetical protein GGR58DRAFT_462513 [Xylaria digitata]|nr:hypothetical protein GGR58DRAFT_462513 [Xylaria digitata]
MHIHRALLVSFATSAICAPLALKSTTAIAAKGVDRKSPQPPIWNGGMEFGAANSKRESPTPPLWDGGIDTGADTE